MRTSRSERQHCARFGSSRCPPTTTRLAYTDAQTRDPSPATTPPAHVFSLLHPLSPPSSCTPIHLHPTPSHLFTLVFRILCLTNPCSPSLQLELMLP